MIRYILFDLDNTLYSSDYGLEAAVAQRIRRFTAQFLGITEEEAAKRRKQTISRYGTTLEWLMDSEGLTDVETYYAAIHPEGEEAALHPDPEIHGFLTSIPIPKAILTNSPIEHAQRVIKKLALEGIFTHIFDIRWNGLKGKPQESVFRNVLTALQCQPQEVLFVDDCPSYIEGYVKIGGNGVLLDEKGAYSDFPYTRISSILEIPQLLKMECNV
jgi:putative hydrolase of the HAD superfamily